MRIHVKESTLVQPATPRPRPTTIAVSNVDMVMPLNYHTRTVQFFRFNGDSMFLDSAVLKSALSRTLDPFYPVAGRLKWNRKRIEISCNDEGVLFVEAECDGSMDELGDFSPRPDLVFVPPVDYSKGIDTYPLLLVQVTRFKCGGVCLGSGTEHRTFDGFSSLHFLNTWSDVARSLNVTVPPFLDRTVLSARNPPQPQFPHLEYQLPPPLKAPQPEDPSVSKTSIFKRFKLTQDQLNALKAKCHDNYEINGTYYTTFEVVAGHAWRCLTKARQLSEDQVSKMYVPINGRPRFQPPLPQEYFGSSIFYAMPVATADELLTKPLKLCVGKIHDAVARIDNDYARSALDFLELQHDLISLAWGPHKCQSPNLAIVSWAKLPLYKMNFGWGQPVYVGIGCVPVQGCVYVMANPVNDGSLWVGLTLLEDRLKLFEEAFYSEDTY